MYEWCIVLLSMKPDNTDNWRVIVGFISEDECDYYAAEHEQEFHGFNVAYVKHELRKPKVVAV